MALCTWPTVQCTCHGCVVRFVAQWGSCLPVCLPRTPRRPNHVLSYPACLPDVCGWKRKCHRKYNDIWHVLYINDMRRNDDDSPSNDAGAGKIGVWMGC